MPHNKLRREIELHIRTWNGDALEHVRTGNALLERALTALGGPVADHRPVESTVTITPVGVPVVQYPVGRIDLPTAIGGPLVPAPATEAEWADLGRPEVAPINPGTCAVIDGIAEGEDSGID